MSLPELTIPDGGSTAPAGGSPAANNTVSIKDILGKELGREFTDDSSALKAVKETFSYVGEYGKYRPAIEKLRASRGDPKAIEYLNRILEQPENTVLDTSNFISREQYESDMFFRENPQYSDPDVRRLVELSAKAEGRKVSDVVNDESFKRIFQKSARYDEYEKTRSVLVSNPRLGQVHDKMTQAKELRKSGDISSAQNIATSAVIDAFDLRA